MFSFASKYAYTPKPRAQQVSEEKDKEKREENEDKMDKFEDEDDCEDDCEAVDFDDDDLALNLNDVEESKQQSFSPPILQAPQEEKKSGSFLGGLFSRNRAQAPSQALPQAPPPPPQYQKFARKPAKKIQNVSTNVFRVNLGFLSSAVDFATGDPNFCIQCKATLSSIDILEKFTEGDIEKFNWTCRFCGNLNILSIDEEEVPKSDPVDYVLEAPLQEANVDDSYYIVFCIDISGSMCVTYEMEGKHQLKGNKLDKLRGLNDENAPQWLPGQNKNVTYVSRLQIVQAAIEAQLKSISKQNPNVKVAIVTFNNDVSIIGDGSSPVQVISGDTLYNYEELLSQSNNCKLENSIALTEKDLNQKLFGLEEGGQTALGPALLVSTGIAAQKSGSKVVICTDGLANIGLGGMDTDDESTLENSRSFYQNVGNFAKSNGVMISVITIPGSQAGIEQLGLLSDLTSGTVDTVDPREMKDLFTSMLAVPIVATNVSLKVIVYKSFFVREADQEVEENSLVKELGNATSESDLSFVYGHRKNDEINNNNNNNNNNDETKKEELAKVPFQLQVYFTKLDGTKCIRVINPVQEVTDDKKKAEEDVEVDILAPFAIDHAAKLARKGDYVGARLANKAHKQLLQRATKPEANNELVNNYYEQNKAFESNIWNEQVSEMNSGHSIFEKSDAVSKRRQNKRNDNVSNMLYNMSSNNRSKMNKKY